MKLNMKQKEYILDECMEPGDLYKVFDSISRSYTLEQDWAIYPGDYGWWDLYYEGEKLTELNFKTYPQRLAKIRELS